MNENSIRRLQNQLRFLSLYYNSVEEIAVDGFYGDETISAVKELQKIFGFEPTGEADELTLNAINDTYRFLSKQSAPALGVELFPLNKEFIEYGSSDDSAVVLNIMLRKLGFTFKNLPKIESIYYFGDDTARAVEIIRQAYGVQASGGVDRATWSVIAALYNAYSGDKN